MASPGFTVAGSAGQTAVAVQSSPNFSVSTGFWSVPSTIATGVDGPAATPRALALEPSFPNPFNPTTTIPFALPSESFVELNVFDASGRLVRELVGEVRPAGVHHEPFVATSLASGIYFCRLEAEGQVRTRKLVLLK